MGIFGFLEFLHPWDSSVPVVLLLPKICQFPGFIYPLNLGIFGALLIFGICILGFPGFADFLGFFSLQFSAPTQTSLPGNSSMSSWTPSTGRSGTRWCSNWTWWSETRPRAPSSCTGSHSSRTRCTPAITFTFGATASTATATSWCWCHGPWSIPAFPRTPSTFGCAATSPTW